MSLGCNIPGNAMPFDTFNNGNGLQFDNNYWMSVRTSAGKKWCSFVVLRYKKRFVLWNDLGIVKSQSKSFIC